MKKIYSILVISFMLTLIPCFKIEAAQTYGAIYDETDILSSQTLIVQGETILPQLSESLSFDIRVDILTSTSFSSIAETAEYIYDNYDYGYGIDKDGASLTILLEQQDDGSYAISDENSWGVYVRLNDERGSSQTLHDKIIEEIKPYMVLRAWDGKDMDISAMALSQAVEAMSWTIEDYFLESGDVNFNAEKDNTDETDVANDITYIYDTLGFLSDSEWKSLDTQARRIAEEHKCGVYVVLVDDYTYYGDGSVYQATTEVYHNNDFGYGDERNGIIILLSMEYRDYAMFVYGEYAEYAFNSYGQKELENSFLDYFGDDRWYEGISSYLSTCEEYLIKADAGNPVQEPYILWILGSIGISCAASGAVCYALILRMKSVHRKVEANEYIGVNGLRLTNQYDRYTHTTQTRTKIEKPSTGTRSESGGGGSGRSGKF